MKILIIISLLSVFLLGFLKPRDKLTLLYLSKVDTALSIEVAKEVRKMYHLDLEVIISSEDKSESYRADSMARELGCLNKSHVIAITDKRLFIELFYQEVRVIGYTVEPERAAIVSRDYFVDDKDNKRLVSSILHELGHIYGMDHCKKNCLMKVEGFEDPAYTMCKECRNKLKRRL